jgi:hypothetical protein
MADFSARLNRLRKNSISFVILSEAKNLSWFKPSPQRDSSAKTVPQNDSKMFFFAACNAVPYKNLTAALQAFWHVLLKYLARPAFAR